MKFIVITERRHLMIQLFRSAFIFTAILTAAIYFSGCAKKSEARPKMPEMIVSVVGFKAIQKPVQDKISLVGTLEANEMVEIKSEIDGTVEEVKFEEGQKVRQGDSLFLIDQNKLNASLDQAQANLKLAESTAERYKTLIESGAISRQEYDQAAANFEITRASVNLSREQLRDAAITAPFDGTMGERTVSAGQVITKGAVLSFIVNQDPIKASFHVPERYLSQVKIGQHVEMRVAAYPDETFNGEVFFIDPKIDDLSRTALMKAKVPNADEKLRHGMFANLQLIVNVRNNAVVIPESALIVKGDEISVYTVNEDTTVAIKPVHIGIRMPGFVEVVEGVEENDVVVVEGYQKLFPGARTRVRFEEEDIAASQGQDDPSTEKETSSSTTEGKE